MPASRIRFNKPQVNHLGFEYLIPPQRRNIFRIGAIRARRIRYRWRTNAPYLSGDSFASGCDYIAFGQSGVSPIDVKSLRSAKSIFVQGHKLSDFLREYGREISAKTLISGNSDHNFLSVPELPNSVKIFLCQNIAVQSDPRVHTLPIGIENLRLGRSGLTKFHQNEKSERTISRVFLPPMSPTNCVRREVMQFAIQSPMIFDVAQRYLSEKKYFAVCRKYRFIFACEGNGFDNHRVWEILYSGSFPVMFLTEWSRGLMEMGLPILFIKDLGELNSSMLESFSKAHSDFDPGDYEVLWMPYWLEIIESGMYRKPGLTQEF